MNRRSFLQLFGAAVAATALPNVAIAEIKIALQTNRKEQYGSILRTARRGVPCMITARIATL
jgi:hypothetical protein